MTAKPRITNAAKAKQATPAGGVSLVQRMRSINRWREAYNPLRGLTLGRAVQLGDAYFRGEMADPMWTLFWIEQTDPDLLALMEARLGRLLEMDYHCKVEKEAAKKDKTLADEQIASLSERFEKVDNLYEGIEHLGVAPFRGFAHCEQWETAGYLTHLEIVDQWNTVRDGLYGAWKYNPEARGATFRSLAEDNLMPSERFLFRQVRRPINRIAITKFVRQCLSDKDWDAFNEIYGIPSGVVIGPQNVPEDKESDYETAAQDIAEGGSGYLPYGSLYEPNTAARGTQPFEARLRYLSEKLVLAGTGGKLTMLTESGSGTLAGGAHKEVFDQIAAGDARRISEVINRQLSKKWIEEDFPGRKVLAYFELAANEEADVGEVVEHVAKLATAGYQVDPEQVSEKTGYTVTLKPAPVPAFGGPGGDDPAATVANRATAAAAGRDVMFNAAASSRLTMAEAEALSPLLNRLVALERANDAELPALLARFKADLPALRQAALERMPDIAAVWEEILGSAFVDGVVSAGAARAPKTGPQAPSIENRRRQAAKTACNAHATPSRKQ